VTVPFFSRAGKARRAVAVLIPTRASMTATVVAAGSADSAARTAAAGLSAAAGANGRVGRGRRGVGGAAGRVRAGFFRFSGRQLVWSRREAKRLRENYKMPFSARPGPALKYLKFLSQPA